MSTVMTDTAARAWADGLSAVAVIGAGTMGEGIAQSLAEAGLRVYLIDVSRQALDRCRSQIAHNLALAADAGLASVSPADVIERIRWVESDRAAEVIGDAGLVIETVPEILELKRRVFASLDGLSPQILIGSNTSSMTVTAMCEGMATARRVVGLHYFNPAHILPAVEIHRGRETSDDSVERARAILRRCGKTPLVIHKEIPGFVINRLTGALMREIGYLLDSGVIDAADLDAGVKASLGFRMAWVGPMEGSDFTGLDIGARVQTNLFPSLSNRTGPSQTLLDKVSRGELGVKAGRGWYDYAGQDRAAILNARNRDLLRQLKSFRDSQIDREAQTPP